MTRTADASGALDMLRAMVRIRAFEESLYRLFMTGTMSGTMHQTTGEEAVAAGVCAALRADDVMTSTHRGHGHAIAKGVPVAALMAEMFGRREGCSRGLGGSMHLFDLERGFLGTTGVVGAGVPIAAGAALALKLEGSTRVAVAFLGDGALNQGAVHEALNLAAVWRLPLVFVVENNRYAVSMPVERAFAIERLSERAAAYGMPGRTVDGNDAEAVRAAAAEAVESARSGAGPSLLECETYRHRGHSRFEPARYRPEGELERWLARDPIELLRRRLGLDDSDLDALRAEADAEIAAAVELARAGTPATAADALALVFAP